MDENAIQSPAGEKPAVVVGVGASAGGLEAFTELLAHLPAQCGMAFVLVQHLDPRYESQLTDLLSRATVIPVVEAADEMALRPNHVYVMPSNVTMTVDHGTLHLKPRSQDRPIHLPIDHFFRSLAADQGDRAVSVVLSGTASDGTLGSAEVKAAGGITFAQDARTAKFTGMPMSAIHNGCIDFVLSPDRIASKLTDICHDLYHAHEHRGNAPGDLGEENDLRPILHLLRSATGTDFTGYRDTTVNRRVQRRMALCQRDSASAYLQFLKEHRDEVDALYHDLLINVTSFFRDPEVFETLKKVVFPAIVQGKSPEVPIRIWVPGCSTGQEAYSLAIALLEFLDTQPMHPPIQIFGTDINDIASVERARAGYYPESIADEISPERLRRFFTRDDGGYRIGRAIRDMCIFARHDVTTDAPFSRLDLITCRNLLIYLTLPLQQRIIPMFHYALNPKGFLLLGLSETVGRFSELFDVVDQEHRVYAKNPALTHVHPYLEGSPFPIRYSAAEGAVVVRPPTAADLQREADRVALSRYTPAGVLVNDALDVLQFRGRTAPYLEPPQGEASLNLLRMVKESLLRELRSALEAARKQNTTIRKEGITVRDGQSVQTIALEIIPIRLAQSGTGGYLVLFDAPLIARDLLAQTTSTGTSDSSSLEEVQRLRKELADLREYLQTTIDQHAAGNEELKAATEEALSTNEELQSTNEELQTAQEELQSTNEELQTLNDELRDRNREISQTSDDLTNLLASIMLPVVMVRMDLRIRRFTPAAAKLLNLIPTDIGRPITHIRPALPLPDLEPLIAEVIASVDVLEREIPDQDGRWYQLLIHPYRTADNRIDGTVLVIRDITGARKAEQLLRGQMTDAVDSSAAKDQFLAVLSHELRTPLTPVLLAASAMESRPDLPSDVRDEIAVMRRNVGLEARLIDDLLDITRIAKGKIEMRFHAQDACELLKQTLDICRSDAEAKQMRVNVELKATHSCVMADGPRLQQVFWNLMRNAIKFTPAQGQIDVRCRNRADQIVFEVSDNGIGIEPDVLPRLFNTFEQGTRATTRQFGGLGLGLAISKMIVELHHGSIAALSRGKGQGASFTVTLPVTDDTMCTVPSKDLTLSPEAARSPKEHAVSRLLLVEDHGDTARLMAQLLRNMRYEVATAGDIATAKRLAGDRQFDLVISDVGLPDGSGMDLMAYLREHYGLKGIAMTGYGMEKDREQAKAAGFVEHLVKPIDVGQLKAALVQCLEDSG